MKILIVDDIAENILLLETLFQGGGYETVSARNGKDALKRLREGPCDLILADILMPVMDGFQLCRICKADPGLRRIPFVFYTATYTEKRDEEFALALGADRFVIKPQGPERLLEIMKEVLDLPEFEVTADEEQPGMDDKTYFAAHNERVIGKLEKRTAELANIYLALHESEEKYRLVVENAAEAILIVQEWVIRYANPGSIRLTGYPEEILTSRPFAEFIHPEDRGMVLEHHRRRVAGQEVPAVYPFRIVTGDGTVRWVEIHAVVVVWKGNPATLNFLSDITERRQSAEALALGFENIRKALGGTVQAIAMVVEARDPYTAGHQRRVADLAHAVALEMGLPDDRIEGLGLAGMIHDIGKISVPAEILSKPVKLTAIEFGLIKVHPQAGFDILKEIEFPWPIAQIVFQHHERMDGVGYPRGLKGQEILPEARILAVADVVEAMASHRPYRPSLGLEAALAEIERGKGVDYDPDAVEACLIVFREKGYKLPD
ncbi:MAG: PAS domain S-box protein [Smithellaceae bacterium]|nr:PAS domain S-box protein [Smithellaceae bacterium]